jgi:AcrR family transcriptional regulator
VSDQVKTDDTHDARRAYDGTRRQAQAQATRLEIQEAARRLFIERGYNATTMAEIARAAGVAYQTVYSAFGNKLGLAQEIIWSSFEVEGVNEMLDDARKSTDPHVWVSTGARVARIIGDRLGELLRLMRESGDPQLMAEWRAVEDRRREQEIAWRDKLVESGSLAPTLTPDEALSVMWALTGTQLHYQLVTQQGWSPDRYEQWLADALRTLVLGHSSSATRN